MNWLQLQNYDREIREAFQDETLSLPRYTLEQFLVVSCQPIRISFNRISTHMQKRLYHLKDFQPLIYHI